MTRRPPVRWRRIVEAYVCPDCDAAPGMKCTTRNGNPSFEPHVERSRLASADGWRDPDDELAARRQLHHPKGSTA